MWLSAAPSNRAQCVRILTGAAVPRGANTVVMQEYAREEGDSVIFEQAAKPGQHFVHAGAEARVGEVVVTRGTRHQLCRTRHGRGSGTRSGAGDPASARGDSFHRR